MSLSNVKPSAKEQGIGFLLVIASMLVMFRVPAVYFVPAAFASTFCMIVVSLKLTRFSGLFKPTLRTLAFGVLSAAVLYAIFFAGNIGIRIVNVGIQPSSEGPIYSLISSHALYVQILLLLFDALGFESYFRGVLQTHFLSTRKTKLGATSALIPAFADALIHVSTLNPLWVITTFIADFVWGLTYYYTKDLSSSVTSHFLWDVAIFIIAPIS